MGTKRAVNLSLDSEKLDEAKKYGLNLSKTLDVKLDEALREEPLEGRKRRGDKILERRA
jgi:post-segregation antitoxin (ccd killing protein)